MATLTIYEEFLYSEYFFQPTENCFNGKIFIDTEFIQHLFNFFGRNFGNAKQANG
jgi:hypothetical protein